MAADGPPVLTATRSGGGGLLDVGTVAGKTIGGAGLRGLPDAFLVTLERGDAVVHAVKPSELLQAGDVLWFAAGTEGIITLRKIPGASQMQPRLDSTTSAVEAPRTWSVRAANMAHSVPPAVHGRASAAHASSILASAVQNDPTFLLFRLLLLLFLTCCFGSRGTAPH